MPDDLEEVDFVAIVIRWDHDNGKVICDLGNCDAFSAEAMLRLSLDEVRLYVGGTTLIMDGAQVDVDEEEE